MINNVFPRQLIALQSVLLGLSAVQLYLATAMLGQENRMPAEILGAGIIHPEQLTGFVPTSGTHIVVFVFSALLLAASIAAVVFSSLDKSPTILRRAVIWLLALSTMGGAFAASVLILVRGHAGDIRAAMTQNRTAVFSYLLKELGSIPPPRQVLDGTRTPINSSRKGSASFALSGCLIVIDNQAHYPVASLSSCPTNESTTRLVALVTDIRSATVGTYKRGGESVGTANQSFATVQVVEWPSKQILFERRVSGLPPEPTITLPGSRRAAPLTIDMIREAVTEMISL
jgi:hypothetical protein